MEPIVGLIASVPVLAIGIYAMERSKYPCDSWGDWLDDRIVWWQALTVIGIAGFGAFGGMSLSEWIIK